MSIKSVMGVMNMKSFAYYNGVYDLPENINVGLSDRSIYFADSIYEVMIGLGGRVYQEAEHLSRLYSNAKAVGICYPEGVKEIISEVIMRSRCDSYMVYVQVSAMGGDRLHAGRVPGESNLLVVVSEATFPEVCVGIKVIMREDVRYRLCNIKTTNLLPSVMSSIDASSAGCEEVILVREGIVTEGAKSNVFLLFGDMLLTHPKGCDILPGITRDNVIRAAEVIGLRVIEQKFSSMLLGRADEVFISSTTKFIRRVMEIDGTPCGCRREETVNRLYSLLYSEFIDIKCTD